MHITLQVLGECPVTLRKRPIPLLLSLLCSTSAGWMWICETHISNTSWPIQRSSAVMALSHSLLQCFDVCWIFEKSWDLEFHNSSRNASVPRMIDETKVWFNQHFEFLDSSKFVQIFVDWVAGYTIPLERESPVL